MRSTGLVRGAVALALLGIAGTASAQDRAVPYWASIAAGEATMRTGPDRSYPAAWVYRRRDLPVRVIQIHDAWRRVQEQDGTTGWMLAILLAARRTAIVTSGYRPIRGQPGADAPLLWQVQAGVVGRISKCDGRWCRIQINERVGYIEQAGLWGVAPGERVD